MAVAQSAAHNAKFDRDPEQGMQDLGFGDNLGLVGNKITVRMEGSGQSFQAYVFKKGAPKQFP
jgi:hypothetical protein